MFYINVEFFHFLIRTILNTFPNTNTTEFGTVIVEWDARDVGYYDGSVDAMGMHIGEGFIPDGFLTYTADKVLWADEDGVMYDHEFGETWIEADHMDVDTIAEEQLARTEEYYQRFGGVDQDDRS